MKKLSALFSNILGNGSDCTLIGYNIAPLVVDDLNAQLPVSCKFHFYYGECEPHENENIDNREWLLPNFLPSSIIVIYNKDKQSWIEKVA